MTFDPHDGVFSFERKTLYYFIICEKFPKGDVEIINDLEICKMHEKMGFERGNEQKLRDK